VLHRLSSRRSGWLSSWRRGALRSRGGKQRRRCASESSRRRLTRSATWSSTRLSTTPKKRRAARCKSGSSLNRDDGCNALSPPFCGPFVLVKSHSRHSRLDGAFLDSVTNTRLSAELCFLHEESWKISTLLKSRSLRDPDFERKRRACQSAQAFFPSRNSCQTSTPLFLLQAETPLTCILCLSGQPAGHLGAPHPAVRLH
jgi:hypothetical protein